MSSILSQQINLQQTGADSYTADSHADWALGPTLHGGCVAAVVHHAMTTHMQSEPSLVKLDQPDVLKLHLQYIRSCEKVKNFITITSLKIGNGISVFELRLSQKKKLCVVALATMTNFAQSLGPSAISDWRLRPFPKPIPDFESVADGKAEPHWVPVCVDGELFPFTARVLILEPRGGFPDNGICDAWNCFKAGERMDGTYMALMSDFFPSMSDTLMRNGGLYDAHGNHRKIEEWADEHPGVTCFIRPTVAEALQATTLNATVTLDIEFKSKLPQEGLRWIFTRIETKMLEGGRMDLDITICNEQLEVVCIGHQLLLVLEAQRKFHTRKQTDSML